MLNNAFMALGTCSTFVERKCTKMKKKFCSLNKYNSPSALTYTYLPSNQRSLPSFLPPSIATYLPPVSRTCFQTLKCTAVIKLR